MLDNILCFCCLLAFSKNYFGNAIRVSNSLDPDQDCQALSGSKLFAKVISNYKSIELRSAEAQWSSV